MESLIKFPFDDSDWVDKLSELIRTDILSTDLDTDNVSEGTDNLYYTEARGTDTFDSRLGEIDTDSMTAGTDNLFFTPTNIESYFDGTDLQLGTDKVVKINNIQVVGEQQAHIEDAVATHDATDVAGCVTALDAMGAKVNEILVLVETHGLSTDA